MNYSNIEKKVKTIFEADASGHDWWHIARVIHNAEMIQAEEGGDLELIQLAALLHDVGDHKFHKEADAPQKLITQILEEENATTTIISKVLEIVSQVSYKGAEVFTSCDSLEAKIVQDADRLDAIGAIGIARAFAFGGSRNRLMYHPEQPPKNHKDFETYKNDKGHTINHFYEKLLLLKDRMQTPTGEKMAQKRHAFMELFLEEFYEEWGSD